MTPLQWAEIFDAGSNAIPSPDEPAANALAIALYAMKQKAQEIAVRERQAAEPQTGDQQRDPEGP